MANSAMPAAQPSTPPNDMRRLLDAVLEAIDIPHPATAADDETYRSVLDRRLSLAVIVARAALAEKPDSIGWNVDYLRQKLAQYPATGYDAYDDATAGR